MKRLQIEFEGAQVDAKRLAEKAGLPWNVVYQRLRAGWGVVDAYSTPVAEKPRKASQDLLRDRIEWHRQRSANHAKLADALQAQLDDLERRMYASDP